MRKFYNQESGNCGCNDPITSSEIPSQSIPVGTAQPSYPTEAEPECPVSLPHSKCVLTGFSDAELGINANDPLSVTLTKLISEIKALKV